MDFNDSEVVKLLEDLSNARACSGFEDESIEVARRFCEPFATFETNSLRCGFLTPKNFSGTKPVVMLDAHGDEVGLMVKSVRENGCLTFIQLGRFAKGVLGGEQVLVRTVDGDWIHGVVGVKPPHFMTATEKAGTAELEMTIDVGATSKADALENFRVGVGEPVVPATRMSYDARNRVAFGKAFDCRAGVTAMLLALRELAGMDLPFDVVAAVSAQEEVGERGVAAGVRRFKPQVCFMFEGCPADDTFGIRRIAPRGAVDLARLAPALRTLGDGSVRAGPLGDRLGDVAVFAADASGLGADRLRHVRGDERGAGGDQQRRRQADEGREEGEAEAAHSPMSRRAAANGAARSILRTGPFAPADFAPDAAPSQTA